MFNNPLLLVFPVAMIFAGAFDAFTMLIPNKLTLALLAAFVIIAPLTGMSLQEFAIHAGVGFSILSVGYFCFTQGLTGGGDAKLLAAGALWIGLDPLPEFILLATLLGGLLATSVLLYRVGLEITKISPSLLIVPKVWRPLLIKGLKSDVPYGVAIAGAALVIYPHTSWFAQAVQL